MIETLTLPFSYPFMQNAFLMVMVLAVPSAMLSCYMVLKGWALLGDALSHTVLPGIVVSHLLAWPLVIGAFISAMTSALLIGFLQSHTRLKADTIMGVVFSGFFAGGLVLYLSIQSAVHLDHILFGNILGINGADLRTSGTIALFITVILAVFTKDLMLYVFDSVQSRAVGLPFRTLPTGVLHYGLLVMISLSVIAAIKAVGIILSIAFLIMPGAVAYLLTQRFHRMVLISILVAFLSSIAGVYTSFFIDSAPAPTIVLIMFCGFICALLYKQGKMARDLNRSLRGMR